MKKQVQKLFRFDEYGRQLAIFPSMFGGKKGWAIGHTTNFTPKMIEMGYREGLSTETWFESKEEAIAGTLLETAYSADNAHLNHHI
jgi:hypothetical protein